MDIVNFGRFTTQRIGTYLHYFNEDGQDWYDLRMGLTNWDASGNFVNSVYGAWATVDAQTMLVTNIDEDPSKLVPDGRYMLGIDAALSEISVGMLFDGTVLLPPPTKVITGQDVDTERDRRIDAGFNFEGVHYQCRPEDRENIAGAKSAAGDAILMFGAAAGNFAWQQLLDPSAPAVFQWIAADNSRRSMDAPTTLRFGYEALSHKQGHIFAGSELKKITPIPLDYATNAAYWPA